MSRGRAQTGQVPKGMISREPYPFLLYVRSSHFASDFSLSFRSNSFQSNLSTNSSKSFTLRDQKIPSRIAQNLPN